MTSSHLSRATWLRLALLLLASVLVHLALFGALPGLPQWHQEDSEPIRASIDIAVPKPIPPQLPTALPLLPRPQLERRVTVIEPLPRFATAAPVIPAPVPSGEANSTAPVSSSGQVAAAGALPAAAATPASELPVAPAPPAAKPVNASLDYRVTALDPSRPGQMLVGHGTLRFDSDAGHYKMSLDAVLNLLFISKSALNASSDGAVGVDGLEPEHYAETVINKATWSNSFARDANGSAAVSFSKGGDVAHAMPGTQDRLTVLLQVGALMQANPALKASGSHFAVPVASDKNAIDNWNFTVEGAEAVRYDSGTQDAWHIARSIRPGTNDRGLELWIATEAPYLPLRILFTEPGGKTIDLILASDPVRS